MKTSILMILTISLVTGIGFATPAAAQQQVLLGSKHVNDRTERDTIRVGSHHGFFRSLRVKATGAAVEFKRVTVHFENGTQQVFEKNRLLGKGRKSAKIDLNGGPRKIDKVVFLYEARSKGWKGADIKLFGVR